MRSVRSTRHRQGRVGGGRPFASRGRRCRRVAVPPGRRGIVARDRSRPGAVRRADRARSPRRAARYHSASALERLAAAAAGAPTAGVVGRGDVRRRHRRLRRGRAADPRAPPGSGHALPRDRLRGGRRTRFPAGGRPVSWSALRDACATGLVDVGSHTHTHRLLDRIAAADAADELDRSIDLIGDRLGRAALDFAYPKAVPGSPEVDAARARPVPLGRARRHAREPVAAATDPLSSRAFADPGQRRDAVLRAEARGRHGARRLAPPRA